MCEFCSSFDFDTAAIRMEYGHVGISFAGGNTRFPEEEQFRFCPMCGESVKRIKAKRKYPQGFAVVYSRPEYKWVVVSGEVTGGWWNNADSLCFEGNLSHATRTLYEIPFKDALEGGRLANSFAEAQAVADKLNAAKRGA